MSSAAQVRVENARHGGITNYEFKIDKGALMYEVLPGIFNFIQLLINIFVVLFFRGLVLFQADWGIRPFRFAGFAVFVGISGIFLVIFLVFVPILRDDYERYEILVRLDRGLKEGRLGFILLGSGCIFNFLVAIVTTISVGTEAGCKNAANDPYASLGDVYKSKLPYWCITKRAGAVSCWIAFSFWVASLTLLITKRRSRILISPPRNTPSTRPDAEIEEDEEVGVGVEEEVGGGGGVEEGGHLCQPIATNTALTYPHQSIYDNSNTPVSLFADSNRLSSAPINTTTIYLPPTNTNLSPTADSSTNRTPAYSTASTTTTASKTSTNTSYAAWRPSMDVYGVFSDPAPSGFGNVSASYAPNTLESVSGAPTVSRTMQYADPYVAVRASLASGADAPAPTKSTYEPYTRYQ